MFEYYAYVTKSKETDLFIATCPYMNIKSQGRTIDEAKASLEDSIRLFTKEIINRLMNDDIITDWTGTVAFKNA